MLRHINQSLCPHPKPIWKLLESGKYMVRVPGSRQITVRSHHFVRKFFPVGEKMTEQLLIATQ